jgi:hypothetical protein
VFIFLSITANMRAQMHFIGSSMCLKRQWFEKKEQMCKERSEFRMKLVCIGDVMLGRWVNEVLKHVPAEYPWGDTLSSPPRKIHVFMHGDTRGVPFVGLVKWGPHASIP